MYPYFDIINYLLKLDIICTLYTSTLIFYYFGMSFTVFPVYASFHVTNRLISKAEYRNICSAVLMELQRFVKVKSNSPRTRP